MWWDKWVIQFVVTKNYTLDLIKNQNAWEDWEIFGKKNLFPRALENTEILK